MAKRVLKPTIRIIKVKNITATCQSNEVWEDKLRSKIRDEPDNNDVRKNLNQSTRNWIAPLTRKEETKKEKPRRGYLRM